ncbi:hypothetical protein BDM02DRAFT_3188167 [Thelephora ganbajun]|uniref:Uncharacterized protein n=1 Tax=Thelephora ganbajun TaxID=370292 RepID=A0ACB6ZCK5_THEGA|nr:hypothetical protein BDM02DRAFT_3188167 [Thelephora ganbajun]
MGPPALAAELTDHIIDFLHNDKKALNACALTHPAWLAASRFHLFNTITVDGDGGIKDRVETLGLPSGALWVLSYVRTVKIMSMFSEQRVSRLEDAVSIYQSIQRGLSGSSDGSTPHLPTIYLCVGRYCILGEDGILPALSQVSNKVTHLEFSSPILSNRNDFWPFVSSFPNLRSLEVIDLAFHHHGDDRLPPQPGLESLPLSKIRIDTMSMGFIIDSVLAYANVLTSLEEFGILYEDVRQTALATLAEAIQANVKVLRFSANCHPGTEYERQRRPSAFDIRVSEFVRKFASIDTLVLDDLGLDVDAEHYSEHFSLAWIPGVLRRISSPIRRLVFEVSAKDISQLDAVPWTFIDELVADPLNTRFRSLDQVEILVECKESPEGGSFLKHRDTLYQEFKSRLPEIERMGLLRCSFVSSLRSVRANLDEESFLY